MSNLKVAVIEGLGFPVVGRYENGKLRNCFELRLPQEMSEITQQPVMRFGIGPILFPFNRKVISEIDSSRIVLMTAAEKDVEDKYTELFTRLTIVRPRGVN